MSHSNNLGRRAVRRQFSALRLTLGALALGLGVTSAHAATFTVSSAKDSGAGTLRQAILDANATPGADLIDATGMGNLVVLQSALPDLSDVTLLGSGQNRLTISGNGRFRVFNIPNATVALTNIAVISGQSAQGAGVRNGSGHLTLSNVIFSSNVVTGAATDGGGGGLYSSGPVVARDCLFAGNEAKADSASGGAILIDGAALELRNCTFSQNQALRTGGGVEVRGNARVAVIGGVFDKNTAGGLTNFTPVAGAGSGGALHITGGTGQVSIVGANFEGNNVGQEGGALWNGSGGTLIVDATTFTFNRVKGAARGNGGGAIYNDGGSVTVRNSTLQQHFVFNVGGGAAITNNRGVLNVSNSQIKSNIAVESGAIATIGGRVTLSNTNFTRNFAGNYSGEGERPATLIGEGGALHASGAAQVLMSGGRLEENGASLSGGALWSGGNSVVRLADTLVLSNTATGDVAAQGGGGLYNDGGTLGLRNCRFSGNKASGSAGSGGAIFNNAGRLELNNSELQGNFANRAGGGIESNGAASNVLIDTQLSGNIAGPDGNGAPGNGGGLHVTGAAQTFVARGRVELNTAASEGGGLWNSASGTLVLDKTFIANNSAKGLGDPDATQPQNAGGGGIYNAGGTLAIRGGFISTNQTLAEIAGGGGIYNAGNASITGTRVDGNTATQGQANGGAILNAGTLTLDRCSVDQNAVARAGGGIENTGNLTILASTLDNNTAGSDGGGLHSSGAGRAFFIDSSAVGNTARNQGGGLWNGAGVLSLRNSTLDGNATTDGGGGGLYNIGGTVSLDSATITENVGGLGGGGIFNDSGTVNMRNSILALNKNNGVIGGPDFVFTTLNSQGYNLIGIVSIPFTPRTGDLTGTADNPLDPKLGDLQTNVRATRTRVPRNGSPVIDAGSTSATSDQRGVARPQGARADIGAVEVEGGKSSASGAVLAPSKSGSGGAS